MRGRVAAIIGAAAVALTACGGGDGDDERAVQPAPSAGEERAVRAVVIEALKTEEPSACTRLLTQRAVEQFTFQRGSKALERCREDADEPGAKTIAVKRVEVDGLRAEADVEPRGGSLTLEKATFVLTQDEGSWKIDQLTAGTLDREGFFREARQELADEPDGMPPEVVDCVVNDLRKRKDSEIVRLYVDADPRVLLAPTVVCAVRSELPRAPAARPFVQCVTRSVRRELTTGALGQELAQTADLEILETERFRDAVQEIGARCASQTLPGSSGGSVS